MGKDLPYLPWPQFQQDEIEAMVSVLRSGKVNYWTGEEGRSFENEFAAFCETKYAVALANGTAALELALKSLQICPGDEVVVTPRTFIASISSIITVGATPVFADVDPCSQNITPATIQAVLTDRTRAIIAVHLAGWPCDMDGIKQLASERDLFVVEDCAQAHGAMYGDQFVGGIGHVAAWSFCQDKIMSTGGEGGMLTTNERVIWEKSWSFKDHGKSWDAVYNRDHPPGFRWLHESFGSNERMTEMQAAIGRVQLGKLSVWVDKRRANAALLSNCFSTIPGLRVTIPSKDIKHAYYKYYVFIEPDALCTGWNRDRIIREVQQEGIPCFSGSCPEVYLEKAFDNTGYRPTSRSPVAKKLGETSLMFLVDPTISERQIERSCNVVSMIMHRAVRL